MKSTSNLDHKKSDLISALSEFIAGNPETRELKSGLAVKIAQVFDFPKIGKYAPY